MNLNSTNSKIIYTALFLTPRSQKLLLEKIPPVFEQIYAHHLTLAFKPENGIQGLIIGKEHKLKIIGHATDKEIGVQSCLVEGNLGNNKFPHITISTKTNVKPYLSNLVIEKAIKAETIISLDEPLEIEAIEGYFDGIKYITTKF